eukprot:174794-Pleurochrysis_carterae.AAC.1
MGASAVSVPEGKGTLSRYSLRALLNRYLRPARPGARKLGGPYQKVRAPSFLLPIGREVSRVAGREDIIRFRTRRYSSSRCPPTPASPLGSVSAHEPRVEGQAYAVQ